MYISMYIYIYIKIYTGIQKSKKHFFKTFRCMSSSINSLCYTFKILFTVFYSDIYNKIVITIMLQGNFIS